MKSCATELRRENADNTRKTYTQYLFFQLSSKGSVVVWGVGGCRNGVCEREWRKIPFGASSDPALLTSDALFFYLCSQLFFYFLICILLSPGTWSVFPSLFFFFYSSFTSVLPTEMCAALTWQQRSSCALYATLMSIYVLNLVKEIRHNYQRQVQCSTGQMEAAASTRWLKPQQYNFVIHTQQSFSFVQQITTPVRDPSFSPTTCI